MKYEGNIACIELHTSMHAGITPAINQFSHKERYVRCETCFILIDVSFTLSVSNIHC